MGTDTFQGDRRCWNCDQPGHVKADCIEPKRKKKAGPTLQPPPPQHPSGRNDNGNASAPSSFVSGNQIPNLTINWGVPAAPSITPASVIQNSTESTKSTVPQQPALMHATRPSQSPPPPAPTQRSLPPPEVLQAPSVSHNELLAFMTQFTESTRTMVQEQISTSIELVREGVRSEFEAYDSHYSGNGDDTMDYTADTSDVNTNESNLQETEDQ
ncbi:Zinc finger CCHC-type [Penicillium expansum]|nr:Zinc finger CCHC-type [Penicillium expansum]